MEHHARSGRGARVVTVALVLAVGLAACGGGSTTLTPRTVALSAAIAHGCISPGTSAVTANLPTAAGVGGTLTVGAVASISTACSAITVATGADATLSASSASANATTRASESRRAQAAATQVPPPLAQISLTNAYSGNLPWQTLTLSVPTVSLPAGVYPATITAPLEDGQLYTQEYTITIDASGNATLRSPATGSALVTLAAGATGVLSIYPAGTVLSSPTPTATPSTSPTATAAPTATPTPAPSPTPSPAPVSSPTPVATTASVSISPSTCIDAGSSGDTITYTAEVTGGPALPSGEQYEFGWEALATQPAFGLTVPPPSAPYAGTNIIVGTSATATVTTPAFGQFGLTGESGATVVYLFLAQNGGLGYVERPDGSKVSASDVIAAGQVTCAGLGL
jgi:hypothetical protein